MPTSVLEFLRGKSAEPVPNFCVVFGDDAFLRYAGRQAIRDRVVGADGEGGSVAVMPGTAAWRDVQAECFTLSLFGGDRLVIVEDAERFVRSFRADLERAVPELPDDAVLLLMPTTWAGNTRLAKLAEATGLALDARAPKPAQLGKFCVEWAKRQGKKLDPDLASWLLQLVGPETGSLAMEIDKLAAASGEERVITRELIGRLVAGRHGEQAFRILDLALAGDTAAAWRQLDHLAAVGEAPVAILAAWTVMVRKLVLASRHAESSTPLDIALVEAGVPPFAKGKSREQLQHLGPGRLAGCLRRLLRADLELKGGTELDDFLTLQRLVRDLSRPAARSAPRRAGAR